MLFKLLTTRIRHITGSGSVSVFVAAGIGSFEIWYPHEHFGIQVGGEKHSHMLGVWRPAAGDSS